MLKRILYGSGAVGVLTAAYLLGSVSIGGAFAQTAPTHPASQSALASQAKISADQANAAALAKFPGATVKDTELGNENGTLTYDIGLVDSAGKAQDVKIDATTGAVVTTEAEGQGAPETPGAPETGSEAD
jgi:hypothetical protein